MSGGRGGALAMSGMDLILNLLFLCVILIATYQVAKMITGGSMFSRLFMTPGKRRALQERGEVLLARSDLEPEERDQVRGALNALSMRGSVLGEPGASDPISAARRDIETLWKKYQESV
jgi:hypothetical protein